MALAGVICLPEFASLYLNHVYYLLLLFKTQLVTRIWWWIHLRLSYFLGFGDERDESHSSSWVVIWGPETSSCWLIPGKSITVFSEQILQGFRVYKTISHVTQSFLQQPCEAVDKYFHPCPEESEFKKGSAWAPGYSFVFSQWSWVCNQGFLASCFDPQLILLHPPKFDLRILGPGSNQASS